MKRLTYLSAADLELIEAAQFYNEREPGLGKAFLDAAKEAGECIRRNPAMYAFYEKPIRGCRVWPFPHRLFYRELSDRIQIVAVAHPSRRPGYWQDRLR